MEEIDRSDEVLRELVEIEGGSPVLMDTKVCVLWKLEHPGPGPCKGCPSHLACTKMMKLNLVSLTASMYTPRSFEDFQKMHHRITELKDKILHAQTVEEVLEVPKI